MTAPEEPRTMGVPSFNKYFPSLSDLLPEQAAFYRALVESLDRGERLAVDGNISYLFLYLYPHVDALIEKKNWKTLERLLISLRERYTDEPKFHDYCEFWRLDCAVLLGKYEEYLSATTPESIRTQDADYERRACIASHINRPDLLSEIDFLHLTGAQLTAVSLQYCDQFRTALRTRIASEFRGGWLKTFIREARQQPDLRHDGLLFSGAPSWDKPVSPYPSYSLEHVGVKHSEVVRKAENDLREVLHLPAVGEGWVSETALYYAIKNALPSLEVIQHGKTDWLGRQHLDVWIPRKKIAVEFQGKQHFTPVTFFGGEAAYQATVARDRRKVRLCAENGVTLLFATAETDISLLIEEIQKLVSCIGRRPSPAVSTTG